MSTQSAARSVAGLIGLLAVLLHSTASIGQVATVAAEPVSAIWRTQEIDFKFRSERQNFRCGEFAVRLGRILGAMGAHLNARTQLSCSESYSSTIMGRIVITSPIEATHENVGRALAEITSVDKLAARVNRRPDPATHVRVFPAQWRRVSSQNAQLDGGDCELLRAVERQLLPALPVRDAEISAFCSGTRAPKFSGLALVRTESGADDAQSPSVVTVDAECDRDRSDVSCEIENDSEIDAEVLPAG